MNICKIDETTIGYGEVFASLDGSRHVFIFKTDTEEEWYLSETLKLFTPDNIWDMCHMEMVDGTSCLLLCIPEDKFIMAAEMEDGKARWEVGKEQMDSNSTHGASSQIKTTVFILLIMVRIRSIF